MMIIRRLAIAGLFVTLSGCQIYKNGDRDLFEKAAPSQIISTNVGTHAVPDDESCWTQPLSEKLWFVNPYKQYTVKPVASSSDVTMIEVCLADSSIN